jgi:hypothetical protein
VVKLEEVEIKKRIEGGCEKNKGSIVESVEG